MGNVILTKYFIFKKSFLFYVDCSNSLYNNGKDVIDIWSGVYIVHFGHPLLIRDIVQFKLTVDAHAEDVLWFFGFCFKVPKDDESYPILSNFYSNLLVAI